MADDDWFRNAEWNETIARAFESKLKRARRKEQYLRIQACTLACSYPLVALDLLERYFALPHDFDHAQAYVDRTTALQSLGRTNDAAESLEAALAREEAFPNLQTRAYLELPLLIAVHSLEDRYDRALAVLEQYRSRLMFPVDHFLWHAAHALIFAARAQNTDSASHAKLALEASASRHSGLRYHKTVGLVSPEHTELIDRLRALSAA